MKLATANNETLKIRNPESGIRSPEGFTLIEMAIILVIIGLLVGMGAGIMGSLVKRAKYSESRGIIEASKEALLGYAINKGSLPEESASNPLGIAGAKSRDVWGKNFVYIAADELEGDTKHACNELSTGLTIQMCPDQACSTPTETVSDAAFVLISGGENFNVQTAESSGMIKIYVSGINNIDDSSTDMNRPEAYDDLTAYVTLYDIRSQIECSPGTLTIISPPTMTAAEEDSAYSYTMRAEGGILPYTWSWSGISGAGTNLSIDTLTGEISGTINEKAGTGGDLANCAEMINITGVTVTDSSTAGGDYMATYNGTITVNPKQLTIVNSSLPDGIEDTPYSGATISATGGVTDYSWSMAVDPSCPSGLTCSGNTITGTPEVGTAGNYTVTITANPSQSGKCTDTRVLGLTIHPLGGSGNGNGNGNGGSGGSGSTSCGAVASGLIGWWKFEDNFDDSSGQGNNGTGYNGVSFTTGKVGNAASFDGSNDYVAIGNLKYNGSGQISELTACAWFRTSYGGSSWTSNWALIDYDRSEYFNFFVHGDSGELGFATRANFIVDMRGNASANDGQWHLGCAVFDSSEVNDKKIYLDGNLDSQQDAYTSGTNLGSGVTRYGFIGEGSEASSFNGSRNNIYYDGYVDEVCLYNRALSQSEIQTIMGSTGGSGGTSFPVTVMDFTGAQGYVNFQSLWNIEFEQGLMWDDQSDYIRWAENADDGRQQYSVDLPAGTRRLTVDLKFYGYSYEGSGAAFYAVDVNNTVYMIVCDSGISGLGVSCSTEQGSNFWFDNTYTVTASVDLSKFYMVTDLENVHNQWWDEARLYTLRITADSQ